ncbi:hypothetical protein [Alkalimarinus alittae]|uniref:Uncharacterized protein n=1 Tax=Alkalimarinus alittae TaxID=2961619 RepID=A0ABY6N5A9_9ALTE|nr:hypothetical protein [Alkalimarinus alittae]UZE97276.1 hypothetical protein NKI27_05865 [Alkalimarinus alittae]
MHASKLHYPENELVIQNELNSVFREWSSFAIGKPFPNKRTSDDMVLDGFYPYYSKQKCKVLFVGRESLGLTGDNYIDLLHHIYTTKKTIGDKTLNQHRFHALMFYITYGLNNDCCHWNDIPMATEIADTFASERGISFAFMNLSKLSNDTDDWNADWALIDGFVDVFNDSPVNYFANQIDTVCPDIILTMNLESRLKVLGEVSVIEYGECASYYTLRTANKKYLLIDLYHFSAIKSQQSCYYEPVVKGFKKFHEHNSDD